MRLVKREQVGIQRYEQRGHSQNSCQASLRRKRRARGSEQVRDAEQWFHKDLVELASGDFPVVRRVVTEPELPREDDKKSRGDSLTVFNTVREPDYCGAMKHSAQRGDEQNSPSSSTAQVGEWRSRLICLQPFR